MEKEQQKKQSFPSCSTIFFPIFFTIKKCGHQPVVVPHRAFKYLIMRINSKQKSINTKVPNRDQIWKLEVYNYILESDLPRISSLPALKNQVLTSSLAKSKGISSHVQNWGSSCGQKKLMMSMSKHFEISTPLNFETMPIMLHEYIIDFIYSSRVFKTRHSSSVQ